MQAAALAGSERALVLAVDVGSGSARAGLFDLSGRMVAAASSPFDTHCPQKDHAEHDSNQIWSSVSMAVRDCVTSRSAAQVSAVAFDATCSLVMLDRHGAPVSVSSSGEDRWNVVKWSDHRAVAQAAQMTAGSHRVLNYVGKVMSPEMELPKLLWLKRHLPEAWSRFGMAMDLADYLAWRASGVVTASACTLTCKWTYLNHETPGWQDDALREFGLGELRSKLAVPAQASAVGGAVGTLSDTVAKAWGLKPGIAVGVSMIDAHAGALGVLGATPAAELDRSLALIAGTSNCHMALSHEPRPVPGVWGPYFGALLNGWWLNEGGQSATGSLLDHILDSHAQRDALGDDPHGTMGEYLLRRRAETGPGYAREVLLLPDFHGNRSPLARPELRGVVHGLGLDGSLEGLALLYHAAAVGIAYGTRHIVDALNGSGYRIDRLHMTGGHARSPLLVQIYADASACEVHLPREADGVLLGTAMVAATAAGHYPDLLAAGNAMVHTQTRQPPNPESASVHLAGYRAFRRMLEQRQEVLDILGTDATAY